MILGYARTSTVEQVAGLEAQERDLRAYGCEELFSEQTSSVVVARPELDAVLDYARRGDVLVVTKLDRLARSTPDLLRIVERLEKQGVAIVVLSVSGSALDTRSPTGKLLLTMLGAVAAFERELMLERQREGVKRARAAGKYVGRQPTARRQSGEIVRLHKGGIAPSDIAFRLGISRASVYRILHENGFEIVRRPPVWLVNLDEPAAPGA